jgi:tRNA/rRNA methyltransferase
MVSRAALANVRIVVVEPAGARNIGAIARVIKNMGLQHLILVNPQCDPLGDEARHMAVHAQDILESAQQVPYLTDALRGCYRTIATTARPRDLAITLEPPRAVLPWLLDQPSALIFGREDRGLTNTELNYAQRYLSIPANPDYPSLNLAQAVTICCYELSQCVHERQDQSPDPEIPGSERNQLNAIAVLNPATPLAPLDELEAYFQHLEVLLRHIGFLHAHTAASRMEKLRQLYKRAYPSQNEVAMLRGVLSQVEWALQNLVNEKERQKAEGKANSQFF